MHEVAIIGAGDLGGALAHILARRSAARTVRLIDTTGRVAEGKALDIAQAAPIEGFATQLTGGADWAASAGADVIVIADRAGGEWPEDDALQLVAQLSRSAPRALIVCAGSAHRGIVERGVRERGIPRARLFGTSPEALAGGVRALAALAVNGSPRDVSLSVLGVPPDQTVIPWHDATLAGFSLTRLIDEPSRRLLAARAAALWPPGPYALATAAAIAIDAVAERTRRVTSCFVAPDVSSGVQTRTAALPVRLGRAGIVEVIVPALSEVERVALENAMEV